MCHCLRKQQSRLLCACSGVPVWQAGPGNMDYCYFLNSRLRGNDTPQPACFALEPASRRPEERRFLGNEQRAPPFA